jgi:hypothetical protein
MSSDRPTTRRQVLTTTGGALAGVGLAGTAAAGTRAVASYGGADVFDLCASDYIGEVSSDAEGDVINSCTDSDGRDWYEVDWDEETPDGWAEQGDVLIYE